jgi:hypothetical protein
MHGVARPDVIDRLEMGEADGLACKPGSVRGSLAVPGRRPSIYGCRCRHPPAVYPRTRAGPPSAYARPGPEGTGLLDLAPGGVCLAGPVARAAGGLLHHRFTLTAPKSGGLLSVALSRGSPRVGVAHHLALWSPDFPRRRTLRSFLGGTPTRSPGQPIRTARVGHSAPRVMPTGIGCRRALAAQATTGASFGA